MSFMQPDIQHGLWYSIEHDHTDYIQADVVGPLPLPEHIEFATGEEVTEDTLYEKLWERCMQEDQGASDEHEQRARVSVQTEAAWSDISELLDDYTYCSCLAERLQSVKLVEGWGVRLSAPGYMDATEWLVFTTEEEARSYLSEQYFDEDEGLDTGTFEHLCTWQDGDGHGFTLEMLDTRRCDWRGQTIIAYRFSHHDQVIFEGDDFAGSPMQCDDSLQTIASLLTFLALKPGDTDREFFASYSQAQLEWCQAHGEQLSLCAHELENGREE